MRLHTEILLALLLFAQTLGGYPRTASAQDGEGDSGASPSEARELFERGRAAYERELFTEAEDAFRAAYEAMSPDDPRRPLILLNVAQAVDLQGGA